MALNENVYLKLIETYIESGFCWTEREIYETVVYWLMRYLVSRTQIN